MHAQNNKCSGLEVKDLAGNLDEMLLNILLYTDDIVLQAKEELDM